MPFTAATPRPPRAVGIGAFVVQDPPPGTTTKLVREGAALSEVVGSRSQLIADKVTDRNSVARQPSGIAFMSHLLAARSKQLGIAFESVVRAHRHLVPRAELLRNQPLRSC